MRRCRPGCCVPSPTDRTAGFGHKLRRRLALGGAQQGRGRRYLVAALAGLAVIWGAAGAYLTFAPRRYTGQFVFVLPGTGAGSSVNLESIGQAVSTSASAFSTPDYSPTQNYRRMILSRRVLDDTAAALGMAPAAFPTPRVELADQSKLISVSLTAATPDLALERAEALRRTFLGVLDTLRQEEIETRDQAYRATLVGYQTRLDAARQRLVRYQAETGLVSLDQYGSIVAAVERLREQLREVEGRLAQMRANTEGLLRISGSSPELANAALMLRADPIAQELLTLLARQEAELTALGGTRDRGNPRVQDLSAERTSTLRRLAQRVEDVTGTRPGNVLQLRDLGLRDERARLLERLLTQQAELQGLEGSRAALEAQIAREQARSRELAAQASQLDELRRDVQVAEAVFSSALARIDTSRADIFASYPMLQTLEAPQRPERPSSPLAILAIAGGAAASFFLLMALGLTWLRTALFQRMLRSGSSSSPLAAPGPGTPSAPSTSPVPQRLRL